MNDTVFCALVATTLDGLIDEMPESPLVGALTVTWPVLLALKFTTTVTLPWNVLYNAVEAAGAVAVKGVTKDTFWLGTLSVKF